MRRGSLPSPAVQFATIGFYAAAITGLCLQRSRPPLEDNAALVDDRERRLVRAVFAAMVALALALTLVGPNSIVMILVVLNFVIWVVLGAVFATASLASGLLGMRRR